VKSDKSQQSADGQTLQQDHQEAESTSNPVNMGD
jgi:hypothetical protein